MEKGKDTGGDSTRTKVYELVEELVKYLPEEIKKQFI